MLIIPKTPTTYPDHTTLAANSEAWDSFVIRPFEEKFNLCLYKTIDSKLKKWYPIAILSTYEQCESLFQEIVTAIANGDKVFRVEDYLERINLQSDDLPAV